MAIPDVTDRALSELFSLAGRAAVVTGAAQGLGQQIARRLAEAGASICVADLNADGANGVAGELASESGVQAIGAAADVADPQSVAELATTAAEALGSIDIWVNNAAISVMSPVLETAPEDWRRTIDIDLNGVFYGCQAAAKQMVAQGTPGVIINMASAASFRSTGIGLSNYIAAKHGVLGITRSLAVELGPHGIRVVAIAPHMTVTPGARGFREKLREEQGGPTYDEHAATYASRAPLGRPGVPDDVARVAVFLASDLATMVTGSAILVDAGTMAF